MNNRVLLTGLALLLAAAAGCSRAEKRYAASNNTAGQQNRAAASSTLAHGPREPHAHTAEEKERVPAYETDPKSLPATLPPEMFTGMTRAAYQAVNEIPATIAQLPCYCHCDRGFGHKSLHSCFVDKHASQCAICVDEALAAYRMQKEEKLSPDEIRERIIAEYSTKH